MVISSTLPASMSGCSRSAITRPVVPCAPSINILGAIGFLFGRFLLGLRHGLYNGRSTVGNHLQRDGAILRVTYNSAAFSDQEIAAGFGVIGENKIRARIVQKLKTALELIGIV